MVQNDNDRRLLRQIATEVAEIRHLLRVLILVLIVAIFLIGIAPGSIAMLLDLLAH